MGAGGRLIFVVPGQECVRAGAKRLLLRLDKESAFFSPTKNLTSLPPAPRWDVRYYDSQPQPSENCARSAHALLDVLQAVNVHSSMSVHELAQSRGNRAYQIDMTSCGWHALHYIETEMRRFAGEGQYPNFLNLGKRVELLRLIMQKFKD